MRTFSQFHSVLCKRVASSDRSIDIRGHLEPVVRRSYVVIHSRLFGVSGELRVVLEVEYAGS